MMLLPAAWPTAWPSVLPTIVYCTSAVRRSGPPFTGSPERGACQTRAHPRESGHRCAVVWRMVTRRPRAWRSLVAHLNGVQEVERFESLRPRPQFQTGTGLGGAGSLLPRARCKQARQQYDRLTGSLRRSASAQISSDPVTDTTGKGGPVALHVIEVGPTGDQLCGDSVACGVRPQILLAAGTGLDRVEVAVQRSAVLRHAPSGREETATMMSNARRYGGWERVAPRGARLGPIRPFRQMTFGCSIGPRSPRRARAPGSPEPVSSWACNPRSARRSNASPVPEPPARRMDSGIAFCAGRARPHAADEHRRRCPARHPAACWFRRRRREGLARCASRQRRHPAAGHQRLPWSAATAVGFGRQDPRNGCRASATSRPMSARLEAQNPNTLFLSGRRPGRREPARLGAVPRRADDRGDERAGHGPCGRRATTSSTRVSRSCTGSRTAAATRSTAARPATPSRAPTSSTWPRTSSVPNGKPIFPAYKILQLRRARRSASSASSRPRRRRS